MRFVQALITVAALAFGPVSAQDRIVALGGDVTEIIYALGEGDRVVATDSTSVFPADAAGKPKVGYVRRLSAEGVLSTEPDLVIISGVAGPQTAVDQLEASGIPMVEMDLGYTPGAILEKVDIVAEALGVQAAGERLRGEIAADIARAEARMDAAGVAPKVLFFAADTDGAPRAAGEDTAADGLIRMLGGTNVFAGQTGYKALSLEAAVAADPDVILLMAYHLDRVGGLDGVREHPALRLTQAAQNDLIFPVDRLKVMQFGPRTPEAVADLAEAIADRMDD